MTKRKLFYPGYLLCAFVFLFNPNANIIDILPDAVAYLMLALAVRNASELFPHFDEAYRGFLKMLWISLAKIPALLAMLYVVNLNNYERAIITVFAFSFAVLEWLFAIPAFRSFFSALSHLGEKNGLMPLLSAGRMRSGISGLERFTVVFLIVKGVLSFLPELSLLSVFDALTETEGSVFNPARLYPFFLVFALLIGLVLGTVWLYYSLSYLRGLRHSKTLNDFLKEKEKELSTTLGTISSQRKRRAAVYLIVAALICAFDFIVDDKNYLPDICSAVFFFLAFLMLKKESRSSRFGMLSSVLYFGFSLTASILEARFLSHFTVIDVAKRPEAASEYALVELFTVLEAASLIALIILLGFVLKDFARALLGDSGNHERLVLEELSSKRKLFCAAGIVSAVWPAAEVFLLTITERHVVTEEEANEFFAAGHVIYSSVFGGSWLLGFCLTLVWLGLGLYFLYWLSEEGFGRARD